MNKDIHVGIVFDNDHSIRIEMIGEDKYNFIVYHSTKQEHVFELNKDNIEEVYYALQWIKRQKWH